MITDPLLIFSDGMTICEAFALTVISAVPLFTEKVWGFGCLSTKSQ